MFPCFREGRASRLFLAASSALTSRGRVSWGSMTSSMYPISAALYGFANFAL